MLNAEKAVKDLQQAIAYVEAIPVTGQAQELAVATKSTLRGVIELLQEDHEFVTHTD